MRLTTYADYSLRMLIYLALRNDELATIPQIAESYNISRHHLVKVAHQLGLKGYIATMRGKGGGLRLARAASEINVGDVVRKMEPDMALVPCFSPVESPCAILPACHLRHVLEEARQNFMSTLDRYTLQDLTESPDTLRALVHILPS